jgi:hypothetical protein
MNWCSWTVQFLLLREDTLHHPLHVIAIFTLHTFQEITQYLVVAVTVVFMIRPAEKRTQFMFTNVKTSQVHDFQYVVGFQVQGDS